MQNSDSVNRGHLRAAVTRICDLGDIFCSIRKCIKSVLCLAQRFNGFMSSRFEQIYINISLNHEIDMSIIPIWWIWWADATFSLSLLM